MRRTPATMTVVNALAARNDPDRPPYGLQLCADTQLLAGTVYPILARLEAAGYVESWWESGHPQGRPTRKFYRLTPAGRTELEV